jgi:hypothetical protein
MRREFTYRSDAGVSLYSPDSGHHELTPFSGPYLDMNKAEGRWTTENLVTTGLVGLTAGGVILLLSDGLFDLGIMDLVFKKIKSGIYGTNEDNLSEHILLQPTKPYSNAPHVSVQPENTPTPTVTSTPSPTTTVTSTPTPFDSTDRCVQISDFETYQVQGYDPPVGLINNQLECDGSTIVSLYKDMGFIDGDGALASFPYTAHLNGERSTCHAVLNFCPDSANVSPAQPPSDDIWQLNRVTSQVIDWVRQTYPDLIYTGRKVICCVNGVCEEPTPPPQIPTSEPTPTVKPTQYEP